MGYSETYRQTTVWWLLKGKEGKGETENGKEDQVYSDGRRLALGGEHTTRYTDDEYTEWYT